MNMEPMPLRIGNYCVSFCGLPSFEFVDSDFWKFKLVVFRATRSWGMLYKIEQLDLWDITN